MKITQETATYLEATNKQIGILIVSPLLIIAGLGAAAYLHSSPTGSFPWWGGLFVALFGLVTLLFYRSLVLGVDKGTGKITIATKTLFGQKLASIDLAEVEKVQLLSQYRQTQNQGGQGTGSTTTLEGNLFLILRNGQRTLLFSGASPSVGNGIIGAVMSTPGQAIGQKIATFLSVPFEETGEGSIQQLGTVLNQAIHGNMPDSMAAPSLAPSAPIVQSPVTPPPVVEPAPVAGGYAQPAANTSDGQEISTP